MPFASIHFLFLFFPIVFVVFYLVPNKWYRNSILLIASFVFYGWADPTHLPLLFGSVIFNYWFAILCENSKRRERTTLARVFIFSAVGVNLAFLFFYKYLSSILVRLHLESALSPSLVEIILPLGISYLTLTGISYVVDVYRGVEKAERNFLHIGSYLIMFPKVLQGPITRFGSVKNDFDGSGFPTSEISTGIRRLIVGLVKKVLIADKLAIVAAAAFGADPASIGMDVSWFGLIAFTLQIYFDFSGYTDMAIGLGMIFGFHLPENFNYPYISRSITDFWRRWHMSLIAWLRVYIFLPLESKRRREKYLRLQTNIMIVFALSGLWHGASWNFILWGIYFGLLLAIEASGFERVLKKTPPFVQHAYTLVLILAGWVFFGQTKVADWGPFFYSLLGGNGVNSLETLRTLNVLMYLPILLVGMVLSTPILKITEHKFLAYGFKARMVLDIIYFAFFLLVVMEILSNGYQSFLYMKF
jgi:alginate O-acetyltransferase complex protein AlgI